MIHKKTLTKLILTTKTLSQLICVTEIGTSTFQQFGTTNFDIHKNNDSMQQTTIIDVTILLNFAKLSRQFISSYIVFYTRVSR